MKHYLEIHQLITLLDNFLYNDCDKCFDIGEIIGCNLVQHIIEATFDRVGTLSKILLVSGHQDAVYIKERDNHVYWKCLFDDFLVDSIYTTGDPFLSYMRYTKLEYEQKLATKLLKRYSVMIINQAQMIPRKYLDMITTGFNGKIIKIFDTFDVGGEECDVGLMCTDTFNLLPPAVGYVRSLFGVETRNINKRVKNSIISVNGIKRRSIGKLDTNQYVTSDLDLLKEIQLRQKIIPIRRNYKVIIDDPQFNISYEPLYQHSHSLSNGTMLHITRTIDRNNFARFRIHSSAAEFTKRLTYEFNRFLTSSDTLTVRPANIITPVDVNKHFFKQIVYVATDKCNEINRRELYTLVKYSQNLVFAKTR